MAKSDPGYEFEEDLPAGASSPRTGTAHTRPLENTVRRRSSEIESRLAAQFVTAPSRPLPITAPTTGNALAESMIFTWAHEAKPFIRPDPQQARVINATITENGIRTQFPAIFCTLANHRPLVFAFTRARLGKTYLGDHEAACCLCENMHYMDHPSALPECVDLPPRLVRAIVTSMHQLKIANVTPLQLDVWSPELHSVSSRIKAEEPCRNCGRLYTVTLYDLAPHRNLASGIQCSHMNHPCTSPSGAR